MLLGSHFLLFWQTIVCWLISFLCLFSCLLLCSATSTSTGIWSTKNNITTATARYRRILLCRFLRMYVCFKPSIIYNIIKHYTFLTFICYYLISFIVLSVIFLLILNQIWRHLTSYLICSSLLPLICRRIFRIVFFQFRNLTLLQVQYYCCCSSGTCIY